MIKAELLLWSSSLAMRRTKNPSPFVKGGMRGFPI
jgi:hypothetical protein